MATSNPSFMMTEGPKPNHLKNLAVATALGASLAMSSGANAAEYRVPHDTGRFSGIPFGAITRVVMVEGAKENVKQNAFTYGTTLGISAGFFQKKAENENKFK